MQKIKKKVKFVIVSPRQKWGGAIALHCLCKYLLEEGYDARIFYADHIYYKKGHRLKSWIKWLIYIVKDTRELLLATMIGEKRIDRFPRLNGYIDVPIKGCKRKYLPHADKNTVVVYPDVIYGNFLRAEKVVRWFLYYNRFPDDAAAYGKNDLFICYKQIFNDKKLNPEGRQMTIAYFDLELYRLTNYGKRKGNCYIVRKGKNRNDLPAKFDGIIIDDLSEKDKVRAFNECEYCISYDIQTAYSSIAALCGCISVIIPESGKNRSDYRTGEDSGFGVAFGFDKKELEYASATQSLLKERYLCMNREGREAARQFAELCADYFAGHTA